MTVLTNYTTIPAYIKIGDVVQVLVYTPAKGHHLEQMTVSESGSGWKIGSLPLQWNNLIFITPSGITVVWTSYAAFPTTELIPLQDDELLAQRLGTF